MGRPRVRQRLALGVEVETLPRDAQALVRRLNLKRRDGEVDGVILVLRDTRRARLFRQEAAAELGAAFPVPGLDALRRLRVGADPGGSALILIPARPRSVAGSPPTRIPLRPR